MSGPGLIVFIDGLGYDVARDKGLFNMLPDQRPIVPGLGYSVNIQAQLFTGRDPDAAGFFCHWRYAPEGSSFARVRPILAAWSAVVPAWSWLDVQAHRVLARAFGVEALRIPLRELPWLRKDGDYDTVSGAAELFRGGHLVSWAATGQRAPFRDTAVFERALELLRHGTDRPVIATLVDFDSVGHHPGPGSAAFDAAAHELDLRVGRLVEALDEHNRGAPVVVLSDHGQSRVTGVVPLDLEGVLGRADPSRYVAFVDSTIVRIWTEDQGRLATARRYLAGLAHVLSDEERSQFGVRSPEFGALIAIAPDGAVFSPSHFDGRFVPRGMHGYHPSSPSQWAIWAGRNVALPPDDRLMPALAHAALMQTFGP